MSGHVQLLIQAYSFLFQQRQIVLLMKIMPVKLAYPHFFFLQTLWVPHFAAKSNETLPFS